ncbi:MAG: RNA-binding protein [Enhydrobacter sp.]|nr:MAG: RNA-binding protein [Enhydrobacter sp.]
MQEPHLSPPPSGVRRTCIVTGAEAPPEAMVRFVVGPDREVVPDLGRQLPGRGMWVGAERQLVERAVAKNLFARSARAAVSAPADLAERVERLMLGRTLADLARARRAGRAVSGFVKVEEMMAQGEVGLLVLPEQAAGDGVAKLSVKGIPVARLGDEGALGGVFGRERAVYVAVARDDAAGRFIERIKGGAARWCRYRHNGAG